MPNSLSRPRIVFARIADDLAELRANQRGTVAVMMAFLLPILIGFFGIGFEVSYWYLQTRAMQNAADSAAIAAASNASSNYAVEANAVAAQYGFVNGANNVTVAASNTAACPSGGNTCYSVTISSVVPLYLSQVVGYKGNGANGTTLTSEAIAQQTTIQQPLCLLALSQTGTALRSNGGPNTNFSGCSVMSDSNATCNGSNMQATYGLAHDTSNGCGNKQVSDLPIVPDPFAGLASNIPANTCSSYPQETKHGSHYSGGNPWAAGSSWPAGSTQSSSGGVTYVQVCGDLQLQGTVNLNPSTETVLVIENGQLDLNSHTLNTSNVTIVFSGTTTGSYTHAPTDNGGNGVLNVQAPTSGPWSGVALYQNPSLTSGVDVSYAGNSPTWDISGLVYMPNSNVTISGAVGKSSNGAACMVMVAYTVLVNGTGDFYSQTPAGCVQAGLNQPTATIPGRSQLVY